ncbi:MAG TPA: hypothetical protein VGC47_01325 [Acidimicrobiia bacterium]|jgi:hypothetical protein
MNSTRYRVVFLLLGTALILVVIGAVLLAPGGTSVPLPDQIEEVSPADGAIVLRQVGLEIDMQPGYTIDLIVDGAAIPPVEVDFTEATGIATWRPGPGMTFEVWAPGTHTIVVEWERATGLPDPGRYLWTFRVQ